MYTHNFLFLNRVKFGVILIDRNIFQLDVFDCQPHVSRTSFIKIKISHVQVSYFALNVTQRKNRKKYV